MIGGIGIGPETLWQHEMRKLSRAALLHVVSILLFTRSYFGLAMNQDELLKLIRDAKKAGRFDNMIARWDRMEANPHAEYETHLRRRRSAKAAANRRKAAARRAAREARQ